MPRPTYLQLTVLFIALACFALGIAGGVLMTASEGGGGAEGPDGPGSAPVGQTGRLLADGDLEVAVARMTTARTATANAPVAGSPRLRAGDGERLARADLKLRVTGRAARPTLCARARSGRPPRVGGAILVDTAGVKHSPRQDSVKISSAAPCESQPPLLVSSISLVFTIPEDESPATLLLFDPREPGDAKGLTRLRFSVDPDET